MELPPESEYAKDEKHKCVSTQMFFAEGRGYAAMHRTTPQTAAYGPTDSPAGLCAWILDKRRVWSDCGGEVELRFSKDDLLTTMTLY